MNRAAKIITAVLVAPVVLVVGAYVVHGVAGTVKVSKAKGRAATDVATALPTSDAEAQRQQARLRLQFGGGSAPAYSWRELDCEIDSNDAGWIVQDYEQDCEVRTVDLFPLTDASPGGCHFVADPGAGEASYRTLVTRGQTSAVTAPIEARTYCPDGLTAPRKVGASRLLDGARPTDLTSSPGWLIAESRTPVSRTTLGCNPWGVVFCGRPVLHPVLADAT
jgi:hypothetical protein